jgi:hypothetical protein
MKGSCQNMTSERGKRPACTDRFPWFKGGYGEPKQPAPEIAFSGPQ